MMKRKFMSMVVATTMLTSVLAGCGSKNDSSSTSSDAASNSGNSTEANSSADANSSSDASATTTEQGKVLNIYCWNQEFKSRITDHYPGYEEIDATRGKIGDVEVTWNVTPSDNGAYQENLDLSLQKQADAKQDDKIDIFLVEADYALKYVDSEYTLPVESLGITADDISGQYKYTQDVVTDSNGVLKGLSWQAAPGVLFYNRDVAKEVFGSDDPEVVQPYLANWDEFVKTAGLLKDKGYHITSSVMDTFRVYSNNVTSKWVVDGKVNIDPNIMKWVEDSKALYDAGETAAHALWSDDWSKGFYPEGKVFCYFGPAWLINFCMAANVEGSIANQGKWCATEGPQGFFWGGTWICAANGTDNQELIKDIMLKLTTDEAILKDIVKADDDFANNKAVMNEMAQDTTYSSAVLGGQNPLKYYAAGVETISLDNLTAYDQGCNMDFQTAVTNYFEGNATLDEALDMFYQSITERYPELTY